MPPIILFLKSTASPHPATHQWQQPTKAQAEAGNYSKPRMRWNGLELAIECPAGTTRSGVDRDGIPWQTRMLYPYGYVVGSKGVDGDAVDVYVGPNPDAEFVYVVHQRKVNRWDQYDEDKVMLGFDSLGDAEQAFLAHYNDPRFLGPITTMPLAEFIEKVKATSGNPSMIKSILFIKPLCSGNS